MLCRNLAFACLSVVALTVSAVDSANQSNDPQSIQSQQFDAGHSLHGEAFNEGPRQAAQIVAGVAQIDFPTSTNSASAQRFFEQGVSQLHGFWYLEAERSFRQALHEDPKMAMAHWGIAMANINNRSRARGVIDEAMKLRDGNTDRRERLYIEALDRFIEKEPSDDRQPSKEEKKQSKQKRTLRYIADLEDLLHEFPDDIEAKSFLALALWTGDRDGVKLTSRYAVEALLAQVFAVNPMHPAHHYRIHLWDSEHPENALQSAAKCGPSSPAIAHMWHMPGHIYSKLKRYGDAAWQQEASARVDHRHMIRSRLMPDQIHNFAHNNEWLVRNLLYVGRVDEAIDLSRNLVSLPRHPRYNTLAKGGSFKFGRQRLLQSLTQFGLWDELLREAGGDFFSPTDDAVAQEQWMTWLAVANLKAKLGKPAEAARTLRSLQRRRLTLQNQLLDLSDPDLPRVEQESAPQEKVLTKDDVRKHIEDLRTMVARVSAAAASRRKNVEAFRRHSKNAKLDPVIEAEWLADAGDVKAATKIAWKAAKESAGQVLPQAILVDLLWRDGSVDQAINEFQKLRSLAAEADIETPFLARLTPVARAAQVDGEWLDGDWRIISPPNKDLGDRPPLDELGPFRWRPYPVESWGAKSDEGTLVSGEEFDGRPRIMIFYLGFGCLHCIEQLHAFEPKMEEFRKQGIDIVAISTESVEELNTGLKNFDKKMPIPLLSDAGHDVFKSFGCWDDFESQALHGTFLIDAKGNVRWQDIGHEPFTNVDFLLNESSRLLTIE